MKQIKSKNRKQLKNKMAEALSDDIKTLPNVMQDILIDDLITAFESRFTVLSDSQLNLYYMANQGVKLQNETLEA